jgi:hypothetical protein
LERRRDRLEDAVNNPRNLGEVGQTWAWTGDGVTYHCVLLEYLGMDPDKPKMENWRILELDSPSAGRVSIGYLHRGWLDGFKDNDWRRVK